MNTRVDHDVPDHTHSEYLHRGELKGKLAIYVLGALMLVGGAVLAGIRQLDALEAHTTTHAVTADRRMDKDELEIERLKTAQTLLQEGWQRDFRTLATNLDSLRFEIRALTRELKQ